MFHVALRRPARRHRDWPLAALRRAAGVPLLVAGGWRGAAQTGVEYLGRVSDDELVALYRRRGRVRRHEPVRGLRLPGARGDGLRNAGRRDGVDLDPRDRRRRRRCSARRATPTRSPRRSCACSATRSSRTSCAGAGLARAAEFTWERDGARARRRARGGARVIAFVHGLRNWGAVEGYVAALVRGAARARRGVALALPGRSGARAVRGARRATPIPARPRRTAV